jgi:hypothetical protein
LLLLLLLHHAACQCGLTSGVTWQVAPCRLLPLQTATWQLHPQAMSTTRWLPGIAPT